MPSAAAPREPFLRAVKLTALWGFVFAFALAALFYLLGERLIALMTTAPQVRTVAGAWLPLAALTPVTGVLAFQMDGVFIGATWGAAMRNMMLVSLALFVMALLVLVPSVWQRRPMGGASSVPAGAGPAAAGGAADDDEPSVHPASGRAAQSAIVWSLIDRTVSPCAFSALSIPVRIRIGKRGPS